MKAWAIATEGNIILCYYYDRIDTEKHVLQQYGDSIAFKSGFWCILTHQLQGEVVEKLHKATSLKK